MRSKLEEAHPLHVDTLVIGAGLAGLSTALHVPNALIVEANSYVGGKARSESFQGYTFDVTGHWLHLRDPQMKALILDLCGEDHFVPIQRLSRIWSHGVYTLYPFQANVYGLPPQVAYECVMGAIEADQNRPKVVSIEDEPENFDEWIRFYFGHGIADHFMLPYNSKLWGVEAHEITSRWCKRFVPRPQLKDIVAGALGCHQYGMGYNSTFLYPKQGGIQTVAEKIADQVGRDRIALEHRVCSIDLSKKEALIQSPQGRILYRYESLINTSPLPQFISLLKTPPPSVIEAQHQLRATEVVYLNVGIKGALKQPDHWIYVPEKQWPMYRVGSFSNALSTMAPEGCSSLYIELSDRKTPVSELLPIIAQGLVAMDLIDSVEQIDFAHERRIPGAYVIYDSAYFQAQPLIHQWLESQKILSIGRYGDWNYSSMEDALIDGRCVPERLKALY